MNFKTIVHHWRREDGWRNNIPYVLQKDGIEREFDEDQVGWFCCVYPGDELRTDAVSNRDAFSEWMKNNMNGPYEADYRFNSGNPMYTVFIKNDEDATIFKLRWMCGN
jgi:hypothetical protein